ncbi:MAG: serine hydrolase domain-containing protein [Gammaproteobacteria bacterium]|nr:serine hydrolase domain-containing protein [Gammaproteobacteria bacterium]
MNKNYLIFILLLFTSVLHAETFRYILTSASPNQASDVSGFTSTDKTTRQPGSDAILYGLEFDEQSDKPCYIKAHWWRHSGANLPDELTTTFNICKNTPKVQEALIFSSTTTNRLAVNSIQVCSNNKNNHRMKGVKITSTSVDKNESGKAQSTNANLSYEFPNCATWKAIRSCISGEVAVGLNVHHSNDEITGLELICSKPLVKPMSVDTGSSSTAAVSSRYSDLESNIMVKVDENGRTETMSIADAIAKHEVNGATVVVIEDSKVSVVRHYGLRSEKNNLPTNKDTLYQAASTSKFVASIAMLFAADKEHGPKILRHLDKSANEFPDSLLGKWVDKQFKKDEKDYPKDITVKRLLNHNAGLDTHGIGTARNDSRNMKRILLGAIGDPGLKPQSKPGIKYSYSGGGYTAAEAMLEAHSGRSATSFLNNDVLKPLGMTKSTFNTATDDMSNLARGCSRGVCSEKPERTLVKFAGGLLANPEEYATLLTIILNKGKNADGKQVIKEEDVNLLMTPASHINSSFKSCSSHASCSGNEKCYNAFCRIPLDDDDGDWYGLGVSLNDNGDFNGFPRILFHGGTQDNARAYFNIDRKDKNGIVIMVNGKYDWAKNNVEYGAAALEVDIREAFYKYYP